MPSEPKVLAAAAPGEAREHDYEALLAALSANARGRAFLAEYARRNRNADTEVLLNALGRLETLVHTRAPAQPAPDAVCDELRGLLDTIHAVRLPVAASAMPEKAARLAALIAELERRIVRLIAPAQQQPAADISHAPMRPVRKPALPDPLQIKPVPLHLAVVPSPDEPELPIPSPAAQPPEIKLVGTLARIPEVSWFEAEPPAEPESDAVAAASPEATETPPESDTMEMPGLPIEAVAAPAPATSHAAGTLPVPDPLAVIMLLSEDERLALFT